MVCILSTFKNHISLLAYYRLKSYILSNPSLQAIVGPYYAIHIGNYKLIYGQVDGKLHITSYKKQRGADILVAYAN